MKELIKGYLQEASRSRDLIYPNSGMVMVVVVASATILFGMLALSVDMGYLFLVRNQLQNAADAAALAGVEKLIFGTQEDASAEAIKYAEMHFAADRFVSADNIEVTFPSNDKIKVTIRRTQETIPVGLFFGRVLGTPLAGVSATAVARLAPAGEGCKFAPWAVKDNDPPYQPHIIGQPFEVVSLKIADQSPQSGPGWFRAICFPPGRCGKPVCGANEYRNNIKWGSSCENCFYQIGDIFTTQTGNMEGPTRQGVTTDTDSLIKQDPGAYYTDYGIMGSAYPEGESPRIVNIPFAEIVDNQTIRVPRFGAFFVIEAKKTFTRTEVHGVFIRGLGKRVGATGGGTSFVFVPQLVE